MKILHTSDVHLSEKNPETIKSLELILELANAQEVDILTIAGDLFDSQRDADNLRTTVRRLFSNLPYAVVVIPGNHDERVFKSNLDFGSNFHGLINKPVDSFSLDIDSGVNIVGVPFVNQISDEIIKAIDENKKPDVLNILLLHCTLDMSFSNDDFGENEQRYFEIDKSTLRDLNYDFVFAGHFHSRFDIREISSSCTFVYPGSPISITWKELGERKVALLDSESQKLHSVILDRSFYRDFLRVIVLPDHEESVLDELSSWIDTKCNENGEFSIQIDGFGRMDEKIFGERLEELRKNVAIENNYQNVSEILEHPLYQLFLNEIRQSEQTVEQKSLEKAVIQAMVDVMGDKNNGD